MVFTGGRLSKRVKKILKRSCSKTNGGQLQVTSSSAVRAARPSAEWTLGVSLVSLVAHWERFRDRLHAVSDFIIEGKQIFKLRFAFISSRASINSLPQPTQYRTAILEWIVTADQFQLNAQIPDDDNNHECFSKGWIVATPAAGIINFIE
jgi:hypothetical protein